MKHKNYPLGFTAISQINGGDSKIMNNKDTTNLFTYYHPQIGAPCRI